MSIQCNKLRPPSRNRPAAGASRASVKVSNYTSLPEKPIRAPEAWTAAGTPGPRPLDITRYTRAKDGGDNQDCCRVLPHPRDGNCRLFAIADGQGGRCGAALASQTACETALRLAAGYSPRRLMRDRVWQRILHRADKAVARCRDAGFTTLIAGCVTPTMVCGAANGDSAVVLGWCDYAELLTAEAVKNPPVGSGRAPFAVFRAALGPPWTLLAMTDGVWKKLGWAPINRSAVCHDENGKALAEQLCRTAFRAGGLRLQDDFTLIVIQQSESAAHVQ